MKVKLIKNSGYYRLCVADNAINSSYRHASIEHPIILASLSLVANSKCWILQDVRLSRNLFPHGFGALQESYQQYQPKNEDDANKLKSLLHTYREAPNGEIHWSTFSAIVTGGTKVYESAPDIVDYYQEGRWSFKDGLEKIREMRHFWEGYEGKIEDAKMENTHLQLTSDEYRFNLYQIDSDKHLSQLNMKKKLT